MNRIFCQPLLRTVIGMALLVLGIGLSGCADMSDTVGLAFADPAKYDLYNCKQLETERKTLATKAAELQAPSWPNSPIATITSPCADKRGSPRKPGSVTSAVPHHRYSAPAFRLRAAQSADALRLPRRGPFGGRE